MPRSSPSPALPSLLASLHTQSRSQGRGPRCSCQGPVGDKGPARLPAGCRAALGSNRFEFKNHPSIFAPINVFILCLRMNKWGSAFPSCSLLLLAPPVTVQQVQSWGGEAQCWLPQQRPHHTCHNAREPMRCPSHRHEEMSPAANSRGLS